jgi:hypothetical protein
MPCCSEPDVATSLWLVFTAGLLGSLHCLGMCGPLVAAVSVASPGPSRPWPHVLAHAGRLLTYAALGGVAGLLGDGLDRGGAAAGLQSAAALVGGALMAAYSLVLLGLLPLRRGLSLGEASVARFAAALSSRHPLGGLGVGVFWGLLPCGLVWAFLLRAAASGSTAGGVRVMLAFGAGTIPVLAGAGVLSGLLGPRLRAALPRAGAVAVLLVGVLLVLRGASGAGWIPHLHLAEGIALY